MIVDTSGLLSALFSDQHRHAECARALLAAHRRILSPFVLAEADSLIRRTVGVAAALALLREVAQGAYELAPVEGGAVDDAAGVTGQYADLDVGLTDASVVVLAHRYGTNEVLTLDERHFRAMRALDGRPFRVLPADA